MMAFRKVWKNRHQLQGLFNPFNENPFQSIVTTEVDVTTHARPEPAHHPNPKNATEIAIPGTEPFKTDDFDPYSVNVEVGEDPHQRKSSAPDLFRVRTLTRNAALSETNSEAWLYARVAFLFFCALLISWVPSSINRLYALANPDRYVFGLNYTESLVMPLQGFWNALVYIVTSQSACRELWRSVTGARGGWSDRDRDGGGDGGGGVGGLGDSGIVRGDMKLDRFAGGLGSKKRDTRLERFTSRRMSERLESDESSISSLRRHR